MKKFVKLIALILTVASTVSMIAVAVDILLSNGNHKYIDCD